MNENYALVKLIVDGLLIGGVSLVNPVLGCCMQFYSIHIQEINLFLHLPF